MIRARCQALFASVVGDSIVLDLLALDGVDDDQPISRGLPFSLGFAATADDRGFAKMVVMMERWAAESVILQLVVTESDVSKRLVFTAPDARLVLDVADAF